MPHLRFLIGVLVASVCLVACGGESPLDPPRIASAASTTVPPPSGFGANAVSVAEIDLAWGASSTRVNGFQVYRSTTGLSGAYTLLANLAGNPRRYADDGLAAATEYCYEVRASQTEEKKISYSPFAGPACATTLSPPPLPIAPPSSVRAIPAQDAYTPWDQSRIDLTWTDNSANEDGFRIEQANSAAGPWTEVKTAPANATSSYWYAWREQQTCFRVTAFNASVTSNPSAASCTVAPADPTNVAARGTGHGIDLTWSDNSAFEDGYRVSRTDSSGVWTGLATLPANATSYNDAAVSPDVTYIYRVQALKDGGASDYSNQAVGVIATVRPAAPGDLAVTYWADSSFGGWLYFSAWWTDNSGNEQGFRLEASSDGISGWRTYTTTSAFAPQYSVKYDLFAAGPVSECYRVVAFNAAGDSDPSGVFCTGWGNGPSDLSAKIADAHSVDLFWTDNARFESGYSVARLRMSDSLWEYVADLPADAISYHDSGLESGQEYWYVVSVVYPLTWNEDYANEAGVSVTMPP